MNVKALIFLPLLLIVHSNNVAAQDDDPGVACREAAELFDANDIAAALEEARWCVESLEQLKQQGTANLFPDSINGFNGGDVETQNAMGMSITERTYSKGSNTIEVNYTGGGAAAGGLAALANMGMTMGGGGKKLRIQRHVVLDTSDNNSAEFIVTMKSGGMLNVSSSNTDYDTVLAFLKLFPIKEIDKAVGQ